MKRPWPRDAVIIVASNWGKEDRAKMRGSVFEAYCRLCKARLAADIYTVKVAMNLPSRMGRPVEFFCTTCNAQHDQGTINEVHDHRRRRCP